MYAQANATLNSQLKKLNDLLESLKETNKDVPAIDLDILEWNEIRNDFFVEISEEQLRKYTLFVKMKSSESKPSWSAFYKDILIYEHNLPINVRVDQLRYRMTNEECINTNDILVLSYMTQFKDKTLLAFQKVLKCKTKSVLKQELIMINKYLDSKYSDNDLSRCDDILFSIVKLYSAINVKK